MATMTLKNVPEKLVERLKLEARENRRSLNQEALLRLERSLESRRRSGAETVASLRLLHKRFSRPAFLTDRFLERAKNEGRP
jgi:plasmid stability protein